MVFATRSSERANEWHLQNRGLCLPARNLPCSNASIECNAKEQNDIAKQAVNRTDKRTRKNPHLPTRSSGLSTNTALVPSNFNFAVNIALILP